MPDEYAAERALMTSALDQDWAHLRELVISHNPAILYELHQRLEPDLAMADLPEVDKPFVASLARLAIRQIFANVGDHLAARIGGDL